MKSLRVFTITMAVALSLIAGRASAQIVVDQVADALAPFNPSGELGGPIIADFQSALQTFTVGVGGTLAGVELQVQQGGGPPVPTGDLIVSILGTTGGAPNFNQNFGSVSLPASSMPPFDNFATAPFTLFDVSGLGIAVTPGDVLAIEVSYPTDVGSYFVWDAEVDAYPGGTSYIYEPLGGFIFATSRDLGFRTTVLIPEPASAALLMLGGMALRRRR